MAILENSPNKLLRESNMPKVKANMITPFIGGFVLNIPKKTYPIRTASNKKPRYPIGIKSARFFSGLNIAISSFHNDANIEA